jgi:hypothetical protein
MVVFVDEACAIAIVSSGQVNHEAHKNYDQPNRHHANCADFYEQQQRDQNNREQAVFLNTP